MPAKQPRCLALLALLSALLTAELAAQTPTELKPAAQEQTAPIASPNPTEQSEVPEVPGLSGLLHGFNAGASFSGYHDSATGWATVFQPAVGYSFSDIFAVDVTVPIYLYRLAETTATNPRPDARLVPRRGEVGDVIFALHAQFLPPGFDYQATFSATAPTGDAVYGLSSGHPTFDFSNHFDHNFAHLSPSVELGVGDSAQLVNPLVTKNYTSLGPLAHFQAGLAVPLFWGLSFDASTYEQLPIGDQKIYSTITRRGRTTTVVTGRSVAEDNGFIGALDIPLDDHTTVSAYYSHSLRLHDDIVSLSLTYVFRGSGKNEGKDTRPIHP